MGESGGGGVFKKQDVCYCSTGKRRECESDVHNDRNDGGGMERKVQVYGRRLRN